MPFVVGLTLGATDEHIAPGKRGQPNFQSSLVMVCLRLGRREGLDSSKLDKVECHHVYVAQILRTAPAIVVHENVRQFPGPYLLKSLPNYLCFEGAMDPRLFGHPVSRPRTYRILVNQQKARWKYDNLNFQQIIDLLLPRAASPKLKGDDLYTASFEHFLKEATTPKQLQELRGLVAPLNLFPGKQPCAYCDTCTLAKVGMIFELEGAEAFLTDWQRGVLRQYELLFPQKGLYDLSQNPDAGRGRTDLADGSCPCLATSSGRLWSRSKVDSN